MIKDKLQKELHEALDLCGALDKATDTLTAGIVQFELALYDLRLNLQVRVPISQSRKLAYVKTNGNWRLVVETEADTIPLINASRELRIECATQFPALLEALSGMARQQFERVQQASGVVQECIALASDTLKERKE
jgi:hypothetical protein